MHFSIPETQELKDSKNGHTYMVIDKLVYYDQFFIFIFFSFFKAYNIHANGFFHCILRYKQFYNFNEQVNKISHV